MDAQQAAAAEHSLTAAAAAAQTASSSGGPPLPPHVVACHSLTVPSSLPVMMSGSSGWKQTVEMLCAWPSSVCGWEEQEGSCGRRVSRQASRDGGRSTHKCADKLLPAKAANGPSQPLTWMHALVCQPHTLPSADQSTGQSSTVTRARASHLDARLGLVVPHLDQPVVGAGDEVGAVAACGQGRHTAGVRGRMCRMQDRRLLRCGGGVQLERALQGERACGLPSTASCLELFARHCQQARPTHPSSSRRS